MSIPASEYHAYRDRIQAIVAYGTREQLEALYREMQGRYGNDEDIVRLDKMYNHRWSIL